MYLLFRLNVTDWSVLCILCPSLISYSFSTLGQSGHSAAVCSYAVLCSDRGQVNAAIRRWCWCDGEVVMMARLLDDWMRWEWHGWTVTISPVVTCVTMCWVQHIMTVKPNTDCKKLIPPNVQGLYLSDFEIIWDKTPKFPLSHDLISGQISVVIGHSLD